MPTSFSVDLNQYYLYRTIGGVGKVLEQKIDRSDVICCLNDLGYNNISEKGMHRSRFGIIPGLEETLEKATFGIPANAYVDVKAMGKESKFLMFTFSY